MFMSETLQNLIDIAWVEAVDKPLWLDALVFVRLGINH